MRVDTEGGRRPGVAEALGHRGDGTPAASISVAMKWRRSCSRKCARPAARRAAMNCFDILFGDQGFAQSPRQLNTNALSESVAPARRDPEPRFGTHTFLAVGTQRAAFLRSTRPSTPSWRGRGEPQPHLGKISWEIRGSNRPRKKPPFRGPSRYRRSASLFVERTTGFEPATPTLAIIWTISHA